MRTLLLLAALCTPGAAAAETRVFAAASLGQVLGEVAEAWGGEVTVSAAGSSAIARQVAAGAPADIAILASADWMDWLAARAPVAERVGLLSNRLVLIGHGAAAPLRLAPGVDLSARLGEGRLAMALTRAVPAGIYGRAALEALGLWAGVADRLAETDNVRAALALVALGEAPLGIVYATDAAAEPRVSVLATFPEESHPPITYPAARLTEEGAAFFAFLQGPEAAAIFRAAGFGPGEAG